MGWGIGFAPVHGDGILIADTRVRFTLMENEPVVDCLQKVHYVGPNILCAFTGSVKIGFRVVAEMKKQLGAAKADQGWNLNDISSSWLPRLFKHIFENAEENEKELGLEIVVVSAHPQKLHGGSASAWIDAMRFRFSDFEPEKAFMNQPSVIGQRSATTNQLEDVCRNRFSIQTEMEDQSADGISIARVLRQYTDEHIQVGLINRGKSFITESDSRLVQTYGNFAKFCAERKLEPFCALA